MILVTLDTSDENKRSEMEELKEKLTLEKLKKKSYIPGDIALVRATDHLPKDGVIYALCNVPFVCKINDAFHKAASDILEKKRFDDYNKLASEYSPWSTQYRSSVHFCLNGIVSSHDQGNFDSDYIVIIEPFSQHENDSNILAVRGEDTYFKDSIQLSDEAVILIEESHLDELKEQNINPKIRIIPYRGDRDVALEWTLLEKFNIVPELIGKDYIIDFGSITYDDLTTPSMIRDFIQKKNYPCDKHCHSASYKDDDKKSIILWQMYAKDFYTYLFSQIGDASQFESVIETLSKFNPYYNHYYYEKTVEALKIIIGTIGLAKYKEIIDGYNRSIEERIRMGKYPTNNEILQGESFGYCPTGGAR